MLYKQRANEHSAHPDNMQPQQRPSTTSCRPWWILPPHSVHSANVARDPRWHHIIDCCSSQADLPRTPAPMFGQHQSLMSFWWPAAASTGKKTWAASWCYREGSYPADPVNIQLRIHEYNLHLCIYHHSWIQPSSMNTTSVYEYNPVLEYLYYLHPWISPILVHTRYVCTDMVEINN